jgi:UDP-N-acetylglucosamine acyltransferase
MSIHPSAVIDPAAIIDPSASVGALVVIEGAVSIAADCRIDSTAVILGRTSLDVGCRVHAHAVLGDVPQDHKFSGHETYLRIGRHCTIREGVTVHRGTSPGSATIIGDSCLLMTASHVAHNCHLGNGVTLVSGALLGGHVEVGDRAIISGNAAVHQHVRIGELALVGILARITQDVPPFCITDRDGEIIGENRIGLLRSRMSVEERAEIKSAYFAIHRSGMSWNAAVDYLRANARTPAGLRLLGFFATSSSRGAGLRSNGRRAA